MTMYIVVAGGGHMGTHLVSRLVAEAHETVVIDVDRQVTERIFAEQGVVVYTGNATDINVLEQAGIKRADAAVAMTGRDSDNLSFCLLARYYGVPRVLARMLNPQYEVPYRLVGATKIHSEADILVNSFLTSIEYPEIGALMQVGKGDLVAFEARLPPGSPVAGRTVADIVRGPDFPRRCVFIGVESTTGEVEVPVGGTVIQDGAGVILAAHRPDLPQLLRCLTAAAPTALSPVQQEALGTLSLVGFLSGVSRDDLAALAVGARAESRKAGEVLYRTGEAGDRLYILRKGAVELEGRGRRSVLRPPAYFGEMAALTGEARTQTARVIEDAQLLALDSGAFRSVLLRNPFLALELAKALTSPSGEGGD
ncbi:MAG: NAD-binding protein [Acidobacteria bacterium]|nr:NAD-binding protein [Acidobacteriota bacterium]